MRLQHKVMYVRTIFHALGSRVFLGIVLLAGLVLAATSAAPNATAAATASRTWQVGVGVETCDHRVQGNGFLPAQLWINVGDTVQWTVDSAEFHTVTFLAKGQSRPPFNLNDPNQVAPQGGSHYDGASYVNSGLLAHDGPSCRNARPVQLT